MQMALLKTIPQKGRKRNNPGSLKQKSPLSVVEGAFSYPGKGVFVSH
jgi:hypothetical protein